MSVDDIRKLEIVHWRDANFEFDPSQTDWDPKEDYINSTVGWTKEDGIWLRIVSEITPGGERAVTSVPLSNVVSRNRLKIKGLKLPKSDSTSTTSPVHTESHSSISLTSCGLKQGSPCSC